MQTVEAHVLTNDADWILPWTLRHYGLFASVVVHDGGPDWSENSLTRALCAAHGARWERWDTGGVLNDELARKLKNECWRKTTAAWVICADADELLAFPEGASSTLDEYERMGAAVIKPYGFEMFSEKMPEAGIPITNQIRDGATEEDWYAKPILFSARRVEDSGFGIGAHEARVVLKDGRALLVRKKFPRPDPPTYLLHYKAIGTIEQVAARYDATRKRLSMQNVRHNWGNVHDTGIEHALKKRAIIERAGLRRVVA